MTGVDMGSFRQSTNAQGTPLSRFLRRVGRALVSVAVLMALVFVGDYVIARIRVAKNLGPYGVVQVRRSYAVTMKNGKPEYFFDPPADQTCLHSLFPHFGYPPCWHLRRRTTQQVKM